MHNCGPFVVAPGFFKSRREMTAISVLAYIKEIYIYISDRNALFFFREFHERRFYLAENLNLEAATGVTHIYIRRVLFHDKVFLQFKL